MGYLVLEQLQQGVSPHVFCSKGSAVEDFCLKHNIPYQAQKEVFAVNPLFAKGVASYCKSKNIELIHVHDSHAHTFAVMAHALFGLEVPIIVSRRVDFPISKSGLSLYKYNHPMVERILCVSKTIEEIMRRDVARPERLATVHSGIDTSRFEQSEKTSLLTDEFNITAKLLIGNVAALAPHKDYFTFISTAESLLNKGVDAHFFIIGDGPLKEEITATVAQSAFKDKFTFTGFRKDIPKILPCLDVFLITSETEGLGTSILDAFACKVPVVATRAGGIPEIVKHEITGLTAEVKNAEELASQVLRLIGNKGLRTQFIDNGLALLSEFSTQAVAAKTLKHYESVLSS
jgi:glycosyltransferase involved in cell wall biosynthesis